MSDLKHFLNTRRKEKLLTYATGISLTGLIAGQIAHFIMQSVTALGAALHF